MSRLPQRGLITTLGERIMNDRLAPTDELQLREDNSDPNAEKLFWSLKIGILTVMKNTVFNLKFHCWLLNCYITHWQFHWLHWPQWNHRLIDLQLRCFRHTNHHSLINKFIAGVSRTCTQSVQKQTLIILCIVIITHHKSLYNNKILRVSGRFGVCDYWYF